MGMASFIVDTVGMGRYLGHHDDRIGDGGVLLCGGDEASLRKTRGRKTLR